MTASTFESASASSNRSVVLIPSADTAARAWSIGSTPSTGAMTVLFDRLLRMVCPHHPRPITAALIMRLSESIFCKLCARPVVNLAAVIKATPYKVQCQCHRRVLVRQCLELRSRIHGWLYSCQDRFGASGIGGCPAGPSAGSRQRRWYAGGTAFPLRFG